MVGGHTTYIFSDGTFSKPISISDGMIVCQHVRNTFDLLPKCANTSENMTHVFSHPQLCQHVRNHTYLNIYIHLCMYNVYTYIVDIRQHNKHMIIRTEYMSEDVIGERWTSECADYANNSVMGGWWNYVEWVCILDAFSAFSALYPGLAKLFSNNYVTRQLPVLTNFKTT